MKLSDRVQRIVPSATLAVSAKAAQMRRDGIDVVSFGAGEPDFDTPDHIKRAAESALRSGQTKYAQPSSGLVVARQAVCTKLKRDNGLTYDPRQVLITCGGKEATWLALAAVVNPGDEVILPVPYWVSFPEQVRLCGGTPILLAGDESHDFKIQPQQLADALSPRTRAFIFNSPSNPGGFTYSQAEMAALAQVLAGRDVLVLADEMYDRLTYNGPAASFAALSAECYSKTITINAASKSYAMTGWRLGYAAGPTELIGAMASLQSHTTTGPCTFNQLALADALSGDQSCVEQMRREFAARAERMHARLTRLRDVTCARPTGAFYCFPNVSRSFARLGVRGSVEFAEKALATAHVALVPGVAFGSDAHARLSFACSTEEIDRGLDRLERLLGRA
ncbi:MAG: pyridoxal phosphate-dependent aminotransferase [Phycisphaerae bacterium]